MKNIQVELDSAQKISCYRKYNLIVTINVNYTSQHFPLKVLPMYFSIVTQTNMFFKGKVSQLIYF